MTLKEHILLETVDVRSDLCAMLERGDKDLIALLSKMYPSTGVSTNIPPDQFSIISTTAPDRPDAIEDDNSAVQIS